MKMFILYLVVFYSAPIWLPIYLVMLPFAGDNKVRSKGKSGLINRA